MTKKISLLRSSLASLLFSGIIILNDPWQNLAVLAQEKITVTQINSIAQQSSGNQVYLTGEVKEAVPFLGKGAYALSDATGTIWVFSEQNIPRTGEVILIQGEIQYQSIPIDGQEIGGFYVKQVQNLELSQYILETAIASNPMNQTPVTETPVAETPITPTTPPETVVIKEPVVETPVAETPVTPTTPPETIVIKEPVVETPVTTTPQPAKLPFEPEFLPHK
jgi:hypothetical protein